MLDVAKVWWVILTQVGPLGRTQRQADLWIRLFIVEALKQEGLFAYLEEPRNYGQIIAEFGFVDFSYTREVLRTLSSGRDKIVVAANGRYRRNPTVRLPNRDSVARRTPEMVHKLSFVRDFAKQVPARMRQEPIDFVRRFKEEGRAVFNFDQTLSSRVYAALRRAAFSYVDGTDLYGKQLLDVGCGSGHETADIWLKLKGEIKITAVDPAPGLLNLASEQFFEIVNGSDSRGRRPLTEENRPTFHLMSAMKLDFPDDSFDAAFHSLILHWLPDPQQGIREIARVLKPGGLVFGTQLTRPIASSWMNLIFRVNEGVHGVFWREEFVRWYEQAGVSLSVATPAGIFRGRKLGS